MSQDVIDSKITKPRRYPRLAHKESINARMTGSLFAELNESPAFRKALTVYLVGGHAQAGAAAVFIEKWSLPPENAIRDLEWSRVLFEKGLNPKPRLLVGMRRYAGLEEQEEYDDEARDRKGYEATPPPLGSSRLRRQSARYVLLHRRGRAYLEIAALAQKSVSTVHEAVKVWTKRLYPTLR